MDSVGSVSEDKWSGLAEEGCSGEGGVRNVFQVSGLNCWEAGGGAICSCGGRRGGTGWLV